MCLICPSQDLFRPFGDRLVCEGESDEKVLLIDVEDVEDLIYWHEVRTCRFLLAQWGMGTDVLGFFRCLVHVTEFEEVVGDGANKLLYPRATANSLEYS